MATIVEICIWLTLPRWKKHFCGRRWWCGHLTNCGVARDIVYCTCAMLFLKDVHAAHVSNEGGTDVAAMCTRMCCMRGHGQVIILAVDQRKPDRLEAEICWDLSHIYSLCLRAEKAVILPVVSMFRFPLYLLSCVVYFQKKDWSITSVSLLCSLGRSFNFVKTLMLLRRPVIVSYFGSKLVKLLTFLQIMGRNPSSNLTFYLLRARSLELSHYSPLISHCFSFSFLHFLFQGLITSHLDNFVVLV